MLTSLTIKNYALIDNLHIIFDKGFSIITGETGAGKSILLGGLSLVLGKRADLSAIKDSSKKCIIETNFNIESYNLKNFFTDNELDYDTNTIIRREILPSGKSRAFINDSPVNLNALQELGDKLIDIHSQHKTLELTEDDFQFKLIDALADNGSFLNEFRSHLAEYKGMSRELNALLTSKSDLIKEYDYNSFLLNELLEANLENENITELEEELDTLSNVETIQEKLVQAHQLITVEEMGARIILEEVKLNLSKISDFGSQYNRIFDRIKSLNIELNDIVEELETLNDNIDADPSRLELINQKLSNLNNLLHKHQVNEVKDLIEIREGLYAKVSDSDDIDGKIEKLQIKIKESKANLISEAEVLHDRREAIIPDLISQLTAILSNLGMPNAKFKIVLTKTEDFTKVGTDKIEFLFSANKGGQFNELKKAASGGELSRLMLAIKSVMSRYMQMPTIIFDEIDSGVSGEISNKMASIMQLMSKEMQVVSITHLPQIAAKGDQHYKVFKSDRDNVTSTQMKLLNNDERIVEIAEMLGGANMSNSAIAHAKQLLN